MTCCVVRMNFHSLIETITIDHCSVYVVHIICMVMTSLFLVVERHFLELYCFMKIYLSESCPEISSVTAKLYLPESLQYLLYTQSISPSSPLTAFFSFVFNAYK